MRVLQVITLILIAANIVVAVMMYQTSFAAGQDAAGRGMASGFAVVTLGAVVLAGVLLAVSQWLQASWPAIIALIVTIAPLVVTVLPVLL